MRVTRFAVVVLIIFALGTGVPNAQEERFDFVVQAGAVDPPDPSKPYEFSRYYPEVLRVHRGQTVRWEMETRLDVKTGFHTVTFSSTGRPEVFRADEQPGWIAKTERWTFGSGCGHPGEPVCVLDEATTFLSSGTMIFGEFPFDVRVDLSQGVYDYFCTIHPKMAGRIEVVDDAAVLPSQEEIDDLVADQIAQDAANMDAVVLEHDSAEVTFENGQRVHHVRLGVTTDDEHVAVLRFVPAQIEIQPGDRVRFEYGDADVNEYHTVTFPAPLAEDAQTFLPACDPDDREAGAPGAFGFWNMVVLPPPLDLWPDCPANVEFLMSPHLATTHAAPDDVVLTPATYHDSGLVVPAAAESYQGIRPDGSKFPTTFDAVFPNEGAFEFGCLIHKPVMFGAIQVTA